MSQRAVLRLTRFRPLRPGFDSVLRDTVLPALQAAEGPSLLLAGRQGPVETGPRLLVSVSAGGERPDATMDGRLEHPVIAEETEELDSETAPVLVHHGEPGVLPGSILRVARGVLSWGDLGTEAERLVGALHPGDAAAGGPIRVVLAARDAHSFIMISTWPDWSSIEAVTGATISQPLRSKRELGVEDFSAEHFELL